MGFLKAINISAQFYRSASKNTEIMRYLFVAEKNDAAKNISAILSRGASNRREGISCYNKIYEFGCQVRGQQAEVIMTSVSGHLMNYEFVGTYKSWKACSPVELFDAPLRKSCTPDAEKIKKTLEREIRKCQALVIWTDCDREGENIGFEIIQVCKGIKQNLPVYRAKFSEITGPSVHRALNNLGEANKNVSDAVDVRQELDLRTGAAFTRLQTLRLQKVFPGSLADKLISYGSCQFPTLGFVVERYQAIENFIAEPFWKIIMKHKIKEITTDFLWKRERLFEKNAVEGILDICKENPTATIIKVDNKQKNKWRPVPLDTVEMEKNISRKLRINAKEVMKIAEKLYTQGLISYPRTETNIFPKELNLSNLVEQQREDNRWGLFANKVLTEWGGPHPRQGKKSDQAHPPIHPTKYTANLQGNEQRVYEYIVRHFLACVSKDALGHETIVDADLADEKFTAKGLVVLEKNYLEVYTYEKWNGKEINQYCVGDTFTPTVLEMVESSTAPPKLLTEADLIALMEKHGIGTDATHAEHIETIKSREYVGLHDQHYFVPATLGMGLIEGYNQIDLEISLAKPNLRADFENDLKLICEGRKNADAVRQEQVLKYKEAYRIVAEKMDMIDTSLAHRLNDTPADYVEEAVTSNKSVLKCPNCGMDMVLRDRKNGQGKFMSCTGYPDCKNAIWFTTMIGNVEVTDEKCLICGPNVNKVKVLFKQNPFLGEPNPNVMCIGGCDAAVLSALDIPPEAVKKRNSTQSTRTNSSAINSTQSTRTNSSTINNTQTARTNLSTINGVHPPNQPSNRNPVNTSNNYFNRNPVSASNNQRIARNNANTRSNVSLLNATASHNNRTLNNSSMLNHLNRDDDSEDTMCGCGNPAVLLTVMKEGPNKGRKFYKCNNRNEGACNFFLWAPNADDPAPSSSPNVNGNNDSEIVRCPCYEPAALRTVAKEGPNKGRQFYCCPKPQNEQCKFFQWADETNPGASTSSYQGRGGSTSRGRGGAKRGKTRAAPYTKTQSKRKCGVCGIEGHTRKNCPNV